MKYKFSKSVIEATKKELRKIVDAKKGKYSPYLYAMLEDVILLENYYKLLLAGKLDKIETQVCEMDTAIVDMIPNRIFNAVDKMIYNNAEAVYK